MNKFLAVMLIAALVISGYGNAIAEEGSKATSAKKAWAAFECSVYASYIGKNKESEEHFKIGYDEIIKFLKALEAKEIPEKELNNVVPSGIFGSLGGPNKDFIAGRIYEYVSNHAHDKVIKKDSADRDIYDPAKWNMDNELQKMIARNKYSQANCDLIK